MVLAHPCRNFQHCQSPTQPHKPMIGRALRNDSELSQPTRQTNKIDTVANTRELIGHKVINRGHTTDNIHATVDSVTEELFTELILEKISTTKKSI